MTRRQIKHGGGDKMPKFKKKEEYEEQQAIIKIRERLNAQTLFEIMDERDELKTWKGFLSYKAGRLTRRILGR